MEFKQKTVIELNDEEKKTILDFKTLIVEYEDLLKQKCVKTKRDSFTSLLFAALGDKIIEVDDGN